MHGKICVKDFSEIASTRISKLGTKIGYGYLYCVREIHHSLTYHSFLFVHSSFSQTKTFVKDFPETTSPRILKFDTNIGYDWLY